jgi:hypothetical protein
LGRLFGKNKVVNEEAEAKAKAKAKTKAKAKAEAKAEAKTKTRPLNGSNDAQMLEKPAPFRAGGKMDMRLCDVRYSIREIGIMFALFR